MRQHTAIVLASALIAAFAAGPSAHAATTPTRDAGAVAGAMATGSSLVTGASFVTIPPNGAPTATSTTATGYFPRHEDSYAVMTTGRTNTLFGPKGRNLSFDAGGPNYFGNTDYDVTILKIDINVPTGRNCLSFDARMFSEEFPEFPGKVFNDAFIAELDINDWTTIGSRVIAPHNFAFRTDSPGSNGEPLNIRTAGATSATRANAYATRFDGATPLLRAKTPIKPGAHSLYLSLFDQGDRIYDTAVFLDSLRAYATPRRACPMGAFPLIRPRITTGDPVERGNTYTYRARIQSESAMRRIVVLLDGEVVDYRRVADSTNRDINLSVPVNYDTLSRGRHTLSFRAVNRAGVTTQTRSFNR